MSLNVMPLDKQGAEWDSLLARLTPRQHDIFFLSSWLLLWQGHGDGRAMGAVHEDDGNLILYPFLLRELSSIDYLGSDFAGYFDALTPFGFGGPLVKHRTPEESIAAFREAFAAWCRDNNVVSEFVRFHPLLDTRLPFERHMEVEEVGQVVWCRLDRGACRVGDQLTQTARRNVRVARESGLSCGIEKSSDAYERFGELYLDNAARRRAPLSERFDGAHFRALRDALGEAQALFGVRHEGELVAGAVFLRGADSAHFHVMAADRRVASLRPANLAFFDALQWARGLGVSAVGLGGGDRGDDELLRFKSGFAPLHAPRFVGHAIHLPEIYVLASKRRDQQGEILDCDYFPAYRSPLRDESLLG
jgi:serine/alanine adding enzyme